MEKMSFEDYQQMVIEQPFCTEGCPVQMLFDIFSNKWVLRVLFELTKTENLRFGELKNAVSGVTNTMLSSTLKTLEEADFVKRTQFNEIPPHVEYSLSEKGKALYPIFVEIIHWATEYGIS